jgi:hypothetical protein
MFKVYLGNDKLFVEVPSDEITIFELKKIIEERIGYDSSSFNLNFVGKNLDNLKTLKEYDISEGCILKVIEGKDFSTDDAEIIKLISYGFPADKAREAFFIADRNIEVALNYLLNVNDEN